MARVLVIDDEDSIRHFLRRTLGQAGYQVEEASNGAEGMRLLAGRSFDLVVLDLLMPERDGFETIQAIKRALPDVKIVAISGAPRFGSYNPLEAAEIFGADRTLSKPFEAVVILDVVRGLLSPA